MVRRHASDNEVFKIAERIECETWQFYWISAADAWRWLKTGVQRLATALAYFSYINFFES